MDTKNINVSELKPYKKNARTHSKEQLELIAGSIKKYGFVNPGLINEKNGILAGHGSTLIAAEKTGRKCYGMELDPKYCDVIIKRWQDFTGKKATLGKKTFDDIAGDRE